MGLLPETAFYRRTCRSGRRMEKREGEGEIGREGEEEDEGSHKASFSVVAVDGGGGLLGSRREWKRGRRTKKKKAKVKKK